MVYLGVCNLARSHSKDSKIDLENRSTLIKITVIWSYKHCCGKPYATVQKSFSRDSFVEHLKLKQ